MIYEKALQGVKLFVKVSPKASANKIGGLEETQGEQRVLKVFVTDVPEDGKANKAVIALLAKALKIAKSHVVLVQGEGARYKTFLIEGESEDIITKIQGLTKP
jgi:uncharacterized protein